VPLCLCFIKEKADPVNQDPLYVAQHTNDASRVFRTIGIVRYVQSWVFRTIGIVRYVQSWVFRMIGIMRYGQISPKFCRRGSLSLCQYK
jgi:hypothetical protein